MARASCIGNDTDRAGHFVGSFYRGVLVYLGGKDSFPPASRVRHDSLKAILATETTETTEGTERCPMILVLGVLAYLCGQGSCLPTWALAPAPYFSPLACFQIFKNRPLGTHQRA